MRPSNRSKILDAASRVIQRDGVNGVTFESVAAEAGLTRGGMLYHFPSREDLLLAIGAHLAGAWEAHLVAIAGGDAQSVTPLQRQAAYTLAGKQGATRAELLFMLESTTTSAQFAPWTRVIDTWAPPVPRDADDSIALDNFIARLAADGLWVYDSITAEPLDDGLRALIAERLARMLKPVA